MSDYKEAMNCKREIPVSCCPSTVGDIFYGTGGTSEEISASENEAFVLVLSKLDANAERKCPRCERKKKEHKQTRFEKLSIIERGSPGCKFEEMTVDTDGEFVYCGARYKLDCVQYDGQQTDVGILYDMDRVVCCKHADGTITFMDMNLNDVTATML